jgi:hypothetical protein
MWFSWWYPFPLCDKKQEPEHQELTERLLPLKKPPIPLQPQAAAVPEEPVVDWEYQANGTWYIFDEVNSNKLNKVYASGVVKPNVQVRINSPTSTWNYLVDMNKGIQTNLESGTVRRVRRFDAAYYF